MLTTKPIVAFGPAHHPHDSEERRAGADRIYRVQSDQFPRSVDLARPFVAAGLPVCIGGFHVSGCIAMLPELPSELRLHKRWASPSLPANAMKA